MTQKQQMIAIGVAGALLLLVIVLGIILLVVSCSAEPAAPAVTTAPETTAAATETVAATTEPPRATIPMGENEITTTTTGIDVARYQGTIDWAKVAATGIDFAMIRVGFRNTDGMIVADSNARFNMQQAAKHGIYIGVYFFSTAITPEEAEEEANWVADYIAQYPITYPVVFNCEDFDEEDSRQNGLTVQERTGLALIFLETIEQRGYTPMFYASQNDLREQWLTGQIDTRYRIWVAQYPYTPYPQTPASAYEGTHHMWQYTQKGRLDGIDGFVDRNVAWFGYTEASEPKDPTPPEHADPDVEAMMDFTEVNQSVTAKIETNLRSIPSQGEESRVLSVLKNGDWITRTGISESGWSRLERDGVTYYAVSTYLTTDPNYTPETTPEEEDDGINTVFTPVNEQVTAKEVVNLRSIPSVTREDSVVVAQLHNGEVITRTGINTDVGWSRVEYNGQVLYCISSYLNVVEE